MRRVSFLTFLSAALWLAVMPARAQEVDGPAGRDSVRAVPQGKALPAGGGVGAVMPSYFPVRPEAPQVPQFRVGRETAPPYYTNPTPMFRGDYSTGGTLAAWGGGRLYGTGYQSTLPGLGLQTGAGVGYARRLNERLFLQATVNATKLSMAHMTRMAATFGGVLTYRAQEHVWFNVFGGGGAGYFPNRTDWYYGGSVGFDLGPRFSLELGAQTYYDPATGRWTTMPVVVPTVKFSEQFQLGLDVGPIIYEIIRNAVHKDDHGLPGGPTVRPAIPGYKGRWGAP